MLGCRINVYEWNIFVYCVCAVIPKKMPTQQCHAIITWQCVRCAVLWFCFRFSFDHTYIVFSNHDTFFPPVIATIFMTTFFFVSFWFSFTVTIIFHLTDSWPDCCLAGYFFKYTFNSIRFAWINKIKPHRKIDFVATRNNNNNNPNWLFPCASVCENNEPGMLLVVVRLKLTQKLSYDL